MLIEALSTTVELVGGGIFIQRPAWEVYLHRSHDHEPLTTEDCTVRHYGRWELISSRRPKEVRQLVSA